MELGGVQFDCQENKVFGKCLFSPKDVRCDEFSTTHLYCQCNDFHLQKTLIVKDPHYANFGKVSSITEQARTEMF